MSSRLQHLFFDSAKKDGSHIALALASGEQITYEALSELVNDFLKYFKANGIVKGSRIAIMAPKSISTVAIFLATLECGAAYIPIDIETPKERLNQILQNLDPHAFIAYTSDFPSEILCQQLFLTKALNESLSITFLPGENHSEDLAFILYTSGSTGPPKGVCITHENALAFTDWSLATFSISNKDRFSSIAPFHFDLSVFDLYVCFACGGTLFLVDERTTKNPRLLAEQLSKQNISIIYTTPSLLSLLLNFGKIEKNNFSSLRMTLFAGEIFPVQHLHALMKQWSHVSFYNLYGPTETNVCTWFEIPKPIDEQRTEPYPIGKVCGQLEAKVSEEGELLIAGPNVTIGYWKRPDLDLKIFWELDGKTYYRTGDHVESIHKNEYTYTGRMDRMIKKRGYRIEPEEVEAVLMQHPDVMEAAIISDRDQDDFTILIGFLSLRPKAEISVIAIKEHCLSFLPSYMIPDQIYFIDSLPKTSSGKIDLKKLGQ